MSSIDREEFLRLLDEHPEWLHEVRQRILTQELLDLPQQVAELAKQVNLLAEQFKEYAAKTDKRLERLEAGQEELRAGQEELRAGQKELRAGQDDLRSQVRTIREDIRTLKAGHAHTGAVRGATEIGLRFGCLYSHSLSVADLHLLMRENQPHGLPPSVQESFRNADLVFTAEHEETGEVHYFAVEASFTGSPEDVSRAVRNAEYLQRFTQQPAHGVVACLSTTPEADQALEDQGCALFTIPQRHLEQT